MRKPKRPIEVRGAQDLAELWRALPVSVLSYPASGLSTGQGIAAMSDTLRAYAWREHCAAANINSCIELGHSCAMADRSVCRADTLFPVQIGGGAQKWRMATLFLQWRASLKQLHLITLGETACGELAWAARCLSERCGMDEALRLGVTSFADMEMRGTTRWRMSLITPWLVSKNTPLPVQSEKPDAASVAYELCNSMRMRAHKMTALCARDIVWQRLGGHLVHHVADDLLPDGFSVEQIDIESQPLQLMSKGNQATFDALIWSGSITLLINEALLPWFSLLAACGGGKNADKGFGSVELIPL